jgi:hypothetical protein
MLITYEKKSAKPMTLAERREFLKLPLPERRQRLSEQAEKLVRLYESESAKQGREQWQGGDIIES